MTPYPVQNRPLASVLADRMPPVQCLEGENRPQIQKIRQINPAEAHLRRK
jgi:hypothetical protein